jgi:D-glycero-alpha-D-manno-heptose-7-phosphate kinase
MSVARAAHHLEADVAGLECGVQDHVSAAFGGINFISVDAYPSFTVERLTPWPELHDLLTVVYLGHPHDSSSVHEEVIESGNTEAFDRLRQSAFDARDAVIARNVVAFGASLVSNTSAQADLRAGVVGRDALVVIEAARRLGALGWKVNGAGGDGGSVTILSSDASSKARYEKWVRRYRRYRIIPVNASAEGAKSNRLQ